MYDKIFLMMGEVIYAQSILSLQKQHNIKKIEENAGEKISFILKNILDFIKKTNKRTFIVSTKRPDHIKASEWEPAKKSDLEYEGGLINDMIYWLKKKKFRIHRMTGSEDNYLYSHGDYYEFDSNKGYWKTTEYAQMFIKELYLAGSWEITW